MRRRKRFIPSFLFLALPLCSPAGGTHQPLTPTLMRFEDVSDAPGRKVINYEGELKAGLTYRAKVRGDKVYDLVLVPPLKPLIHQSVGIDWTNLDEFPELNRLSREGGERKIVLRVISDKTTYMGGRRWSRTLLCQVIAVG